MATCVRSFLSILGIARLVLLLSSPTQAANLPPIKTVFVILEENHDWSLITPSAAPYINNTLLPMGAHALKYMNVVSNGTDLHPSEPNYIWLEAGTNTGYEWSADDGDPGPGHSSASIDHLVTYLDKAGVSWKSYQEDIGGASCPLVSNGNYAAKHNPFVFFNNVTGSNNPQSAYCIQHIRPYSELASDLATGHVAQYNFITPNLQNDMHDGSVRRGDNWLKAAIPAILASSAYQSGGAIFLTWDEGTDASGNDTPGPIGMIVLSPFAKVNYSNSIHYSHSSALRTIQEIFNITPLLGDAANATDLSDLFTSTSSQLPNNPPPTNPPPTNPPPSNPPPPTNPPSQPVQSVPTGTTYYVDSIAGNNSNNGLSAATAWKTLAKVNGSSFTPGDTILFIKGGTWNETLNVTSSGSVGKPITFDTYGSGANPVIDGGAQSRPGIVLTGRSYVTLRNLVVQNAETGVHLQAGSAHNVLDSLVISNSRNNGITLEDSGTSFNTVLNCISHDNGKTTQNGGLQSWSGADNNTVSGGVYYNNTGQYGPGVEFDTAGNTMTGVTSYNNYYGLKVFGDACHDNVIQNSTAYRNLSFGIDVDYCGLNNVVQNNSSYSNAEHGIALEGTTNGAIVRYNLTHDNGGTNPNIGGIELDGTTNVGVYSNVLYNEPNGVWLLNGPQNARIYNNTVYGSRYCYVVDSGGASGTVLKNNIAASCSAIAVQVAAGSQAGFVSDYNDWSMGGAAQLQWGGSTYNLSGWRAAASQDAHSQDKIPQFAGAATHDFHLTLGSPAIDAGVTLAEVPLDFDGATRPQGAADDMGAFEFRSAAASLSLSSGSGSPGSTVALSLTLTGASPRPASARWTLNYSTSDFSSATIAAGPAAANKLLSCSNSPGTYTCLLSDPNSLIIPDGIIATLTLTLSGSTTNTSSLIQLTNPFTADTSGTSLPTTATGGTVTIQQIPVQPAPSLSGISCSPATVGPSVGSTCTVTLTAAALSGGAMVTLSSSPAGANVPPAANVQQSSTSATFIVSAGNVSVVTPVTLTASYSGVTKGFTLTVNPPPPTPPPTINSFTANPFTITAGQSTTLSWGVAGATGMTVNNGVGNVSSVTSKTVWPAQTSTYTLTASNSAGNTSASLTITVNPAPDTQPPSAPAIVFAAAKGATEVDLAWTASTDNAGVAGYQIIRNGSLLTSVSGQTLSYADAKVKANTTYSYVIRAYDAATNFSGVSNTATVTTPPAPIAAACPGPAPGAFTGCYYNNTSLSGSPALARTDSQINFNWYWAPPDPSVAANNFSVRWQGYFNFDQGDYTFSATTSDGMRIYIDGNAVLDRWRDQAPTMYRIRKTLTQGSHLIVVEYYEKTRSATAQLSWQKN